MDEFCCALLRAMGEFCFSFLSTVPEFVNRLSISCSHGQKKSKKDFAHPDYSPKVCTSVG